METQLDQKQALDNYLRLVYKGDELLSVIERQFEVIKRGRSKQVSDIQEACNIVIGLDNEIEWFDTSYFVN